MITLLDHDSVFSFEGVILLNGPVAQLVRASPCHGEGRRFESDLGRLILKHISVVLILVEKGS